jgi:hypothetical protein
MKMGIDQAIFSLVEFARHFVNGPTQGLWVRINASYSHYEEVRDKGPFEANAHASVDLVLRFPYGQHGSVNVFFAESPGWVQTGEMKWPTLENISNHDSCWRDAIHSKLFEIHIRLAHEIIAQVEAGPGYIVPDEKRENTRVMMRPLDAHSFNHLDFVRVVEFELEHKPMDNNWSDRYFIKSVKVVKETTSKEM